MDMTTDENRYCDLDEIWVCAHCGKHVENDRYRFGDESCMLNAIKVKKIDCIYKDDNPDFRVVEIRRSTDD